MQTAALIPQPPERLGLFAIMSFRLAKALPSLCLALSFTAGAALAQNDPNQGDKAKQQTEQKKEGQRVNELAEASKQMTGPAGNPECVWVGRNIVGRIYANDLDTAFRHLDLYDRFGCPGGHVQAAFRCVLKQMPAEPQKQENVNARVHSCWVNPASPPIPAAATTAPATPSTGTTTQ